MTDNTHPIVYPGLPNIFELEVSDTRFPLGNPFTTYLNSLALSSQETVYYGLLTIARIIYNKYDNVSPENLPWHLLRYDHLIAIRGKLIEVYQPKTCNIYLSALRGVIRACWSLGYYNSETRDRLLQIKSVKSVEIDKSTILSPNEISQLLEYLNSIKHTVKGSRDAAILILLIMTGLRRNEVVNLKVQDISEITSKGTTLVKVVVRQGKGKKDRVIYCPIELNIYLDSWYTHRGKGEGYLFVNTDLLPRLLKLSTQTIYDIVSQVAQNAQVSDIHPHDLRRLLGTRLLDMQVDVFTVSRLMGHSNLNTTMKYDKRGETPLMETSINIRDILLPKDE